MSVSSFDPDVYERLFTDAKKKQTINPLLESAKTLQQGRPHSAESSKSLGRSASNRLYYSGLKNKALRDREYSRIKGLKSDMEQYEATFKPQINKISKVIAESKSQRNLKPAHDRLIESGAAAQQKKTLFKDIKEQIEREECVFRPHINPV